MCLKWGVIEANSQTDDGGVSLSGHSSLYGVDDLLQSMPTHCRYIEQ